MWGMWAKNTEMDLSGRTDEKFTDLYLSGWIRKPNDQEKRVNLLRSVKYKLSRWFDAFRPEPTEMITIRGTRLLVRLDSPDKAVAQTSLEGEFDEAIETAGTLRHGFIVDAGGYIGTAAIAFALAFPEATIVTIEPSVRNFAILRANVAAFPNIVTIRAALAAQPGRIPLVDRWAGQWGYSTFTAPGPGCPEPIPVNDTEAVTVPQLLERFNKEGIDILKLDIEGAEIEILTPPPLWMKRVGVVFAELHDRFRPGCTDAFNAATYGRENSLTDGEKILSVIRK
jgi:FkbM family methyltransferase